MQVEDKVAEQNQKNKTEQNTEESSESKAKVGENEADPVIPNNKMELKYKYREGGSILLDYCLLAIRNKSTRRHQLVYVTRKIQEIQAT